MNRKRKSINPSYKELQTNEIRISILDIENNKNILIQTILAHFKNSTCESCEWTIHEINEPELEKFNFNRKDCLLKIFIERELIGNVIDELEKDFNFLFKKTEQEGLFKLVILIYCEQPVVFQ